MHSRTARRAFTLIDVMIVVVTLGILATVTVPILAGHLATAQDSAARATYSMSRKALDMYFQKHHTWPASITADLFVPPEDVTMPRGWQLAYQPTSGELDLNQVVEADEDDEPPIVIVP
jgi:general secretion pathway protein G